MHVSFVDGFVTAHSHCQSTYLEYALVLFYHSPGCTPYISCVVCAASKGIATREGINPRLVGPNESTICNETRKKIFLFMLNGINLQTETISIMNRKHSKRFIPFDKSFS